MSEELVYHGTIKEVLRKSGSGGRLTVCRVEVQEKRRTLTRVFAGPVHVGQAIILMECDREYRGH